MKGKKDLPEITIGQVVDIVVEHGMIRMSSVQDLQDGRIVLLQITPPLPVSCIGKTILITYLTTENRNVRRSFRARIVDIREGYVTVGRGFPVIIVERISPSELCDLRAHERYRPQTMMKISLRDEQLEVVDISAGGAHLIRTPGERMSLEVGDTILVTIEDGANKSNRYARIVLQWHSRGTHGPEHLAVVFTSEKLT
jgi:hypothetical protein